MKKEYWFVILTGILSGFIVFGGNVFANLGLSLFEISFIPQILVLLILLPFIIFNKSLRKLHGKKWLWILYGFVSAGCLLLEFVGVILGVPVAIVVLLLYTQPLWTVLITYLFLKEKITSGDLFACFLVLIGAVILINPFNVAGIKSILGVVLSLLGGVCLSGWVVIGSFVSKNKSPPITTKFANAILTIIFLLIGYPFLLLVNNTSINAFSFNFSPMIWVWLIIFTLFVELISHILYFKGTKVVPTVDAGIILLLEPVVGSILAILFLGQAITWNVFVGGVVILIANYISIRNN